jgi:hypothetical protein
LGCRCEGGSYVGVGWIRLSWYRNQLWAVINMLANFMLP